MWGLLGRLFGTPKGMESATKMAESTVGGIISGIDAAIYTKEEKARDIKEILFKLQDQFTPRSVSRRLLAFMFAFVFCCFALTALVFTCLGKLTVTNGIIALSVAIKLPWIIMTIIIFYFGYYGLEKMKKE